MHHPVPKASRLHARQRLFVTEYMLDLNATQAAIRAGYSPKSARQMASENMAKPAIAAEIARLQAVELQRINARFEINQDKVLRQLALGAFADVRGLFNSNGRAKSIHELTEDQAALIEGIEVFETIIRRPNDTNPDTVLSRTFKYKVTRRQPWADMLMRHLGQYAKDNKQVGEAQAAGLAALVGQMKGSTVPVVKNPPADDGPKLH